VDRGSARLSAGDRNTSGSFCEHLVFTALTKGFDDGSLHGEFDPIEGSEPNDVPNPDDTDPATRDGLNLGEAPVRISGNDGGDKLGNSECGHEGDGRTFHKEESV